MTYQGTPENNAFKLTRSGGLSRMEALRATMRRPLRPSQLNAMFDGRPRAPEGSSGVTVAV
jgi:hypothetical protein